jgi:hypothetical protein
VGAPLKGQQPAREEDADQILRAEVGLFPVDVDEAGDPDGLFVIPRIVEPVLHGGRPGNICRKIDEVFRTAVPDVEKGPLPGPDRVQTGEFVEVALGAGRQDAAPTPDKGFGLRKFPILDRILPKIVKEREVINRRSDTTVSLHEGGEGRKVEDGIARKMVGLKLIEI